MTTNEQTLAILSTRVRQLILQYKSSVAENAKLKKRVKELEDSVKLLENKLGQANNDYQSLKTARMIDISGGDIDAAKKVIQSLVRDVNKCITLLSEQ